MTMFLTAVLKCINWSTLLKLKQFVINFFVHVHVYMYIYIYM